MKKPYTLDYTIERDTDRMELVKDILDKLETDPSATDLEQMATYVLYGKDEEGRSSLRRGEVYDNNKRYNSYKTSDDKVLSFDELVENPATDEQTFRSAYKRDVYKKDTGKPQRPKYDKKTGEMIDPGDSDIPGMMEIWERLDHFDKWLHMLQGKIPIEEGFEYFEDDYRLYRLKHNIIAMRALPYALKDAYKPFLHFQKIDRPKPQFYDWDGMAAYWIPYEEWEHRVKTSYTSKVSRNIKDYETRDTLNGKEVKWVVYIHDFDWENYKHVYAALIHYNNLKEQLKDKLNTYGRTIIWDLERYIEMAPLSPIRRAIAKKVMEGKSRDQISGELLEEYSITYSVYYLSTLIANDIPKEIAKTAARNRLLCETPKEELKVCKDCGKALPRHPLFYTKNSGRKDGFQSRCRDCERLKRIKRGEQKQYDGRKKDSALLEMQARTSN